MVHVIILASQDIKEKHTWMMKNRLNQPDIEDLMDVAFDSIIGAGIGAGTVGVGAGIADEGANLIWKKEQDK